MTKTSWSQKLQILNFEVCVHLKSDKMEYQLRSHLKISNIFFSILASYFKYVKDGKNVCAKGGVLVLIKDLISRLIFFLIKLY